MSLHDNYMRVCGLCVAGVCELGEFAAARFSIVSAGGSVSHVLIFLDLVGQEGRILSVLHHSCLILSAAPLSCRVLGIHTCPGSRRNSRNGMCLPSGKG